MKKKSCFIILGLLLAACTKPESSSGNNEPIIISAVDLGLSVKWADANLGATFKNTYGDYYAWGETETKSDYSWSTYKWCKGSNDSLTKYNTSTTYGAVDNRRFLSLDDDAAHFVLGGNWRMPTDEEWTELLNNCTSVWFSQNGVNGFLLTSRINSKCIFLPAAGLLLGSNLSSAGSVGYYWSSTLSKDRSAGAWDVGFSSDNFRCGGKGGSDRSLGYSIRPVTE